MFVPCTFMSLQDMWWRTKAMVVITFHLKSWACVQKRPHCEWTVYIKAHFKQCCHCCAPSSLSQALAGCWKVPWTRRENTWAERDRGCSGGWVWWANLISLWKKGQWGHASGVLCHHWATSLFSIDSLCGILLAVLNMPDIGRRHLKCVLPSEMLLYWTIWV